MIVYVASAMAVATWMMAAYIGFHPDLPRGGGLDRRGFAVPRLRAGGPAQLPTRGAVHGHLHLPGGLDDYLVAIVFLRSATAFTLPLGVQSFFQQNTTDWGGVMAVPPWS